IRETLSFLRDKGFIDDNLFAKAWVASRIKKPLGLRKIRGELNLKGIDKEIIDSQINEIKKGYSEPGLVKKIIKDKLRKLKGIQTQKAKRHIYAYLLYRGFSPGIVIEAMDQAE
ncbi:MAG: regulatory protein RecX, partial [Candidatus Omnitrophica bacterium]|nr:regulatory protein RecX [Candidatus Omnitrophota bacterium]